MLGILWGLVTALGFGSADFVARGVSAQQGAYRTLLYTHLVSFGLLLVIIATTSPPIAPAWGPLALGLGLGVLNTLATLLLYHALLIGTVSLVAPITSSFGGVTLVLAFVSGDRLSVGRLASLALMVLGVVLAASGADEGVAGPQGGRLRGVPAALGAALLFGVFFWGLKYVVPVVGPLVPVAEGRLATLLALPLLARSLRQPLAPPPARQWPPIALIALLDTGANIAYNQGLASASAGVVAVIGSLFSAVTVLLAFVLLHERLALRQWVGVAIIFVATGAISALG